MVGRKGTERGELESERSRAERWMGEGAETGDGEEWSLGELGRWKQRQMGWRLERWMEQRRACVPWCVDREAREPATARRRQRSLRNSHFSSIVRHRARR